MIWYSTAGSPTRPALRRSAHAGTGRGVDPHPLWCQLFTRLYLVIPFAAAAYAAVALAALHVGAVALTLVLLGTCLGALMPLSMAISVNWNPELRATAAATEALSRSVGQTTGPIAVGALVAVGGVGTVGVVVFGATLLGLAASRCIFTTRA